MEILGEEFLQLALIASFIIGGLCAFLGVYVLLKRIVFVGITLSEVSALGVAAGLMLGFNPVLSAIIMTIIAVFLLWLPYRSRSVSRESIIGFTYVFAAALAVILIARNPAAESKGLDLISGNLLYVQAGDLILTGVLAVIVLGLHIILYKNFLFVSFDMETAHATGLRASSYDLLIYLSLGMSIAVTMKVAGILFVFGSLVVPPLFGLILFRRMLWIFTGSILFSLLSSLVGVIASIYLDWPTSPTILVTLCILLFAVALAKGILGHALR